MGSLCDICRTIPFREIQENPDLKIKRVKLGDYDDVNQRVSCPFCCLALQSIRDVADRLGYSDTAEYLRKDCFGTSIEVQWRQQDRAFETGAFPLRYTTGSFPSLARVVHSEPVSIDPIISCLEDCEKGHQCSLSISDEDVEKLPFLRAIDVRQMCVAYIPPSTRYVALSYIWGGAPALYLQRANIREFMRPGGLKTYDDEIPATIRDAIELVRKMNLEYLWVDALCLIQDDDEDMTIGINAMSIIYEHSYFTIVAAGGITAHSGLAGVSPRNVSQVKGEIVPGVSLIEIYPIGDLLEIAYYNRRAWTFQEFHLSRRKVIFHNNMLYYQCMKGSWSEDIQGVPIESRIRYRALAPTRPGQMLYEFRLIIKDYTIRDATYQHDIVNAMVSIYHKLLGREYGGHLFAVPVVAFDAFLCFYNKDDHHKFLERRESLPSWTWSGWRGDFYWACSSDDNETLLWIADSTWIVWYLRDSYGDLKLVWELAQGQHK
ncbi:hypothetical protein NUW58_g1430 [Xylaria curta]|uniref:Uncharacterized protein n=1 Tax=Xylaria curta TaxID=42375 RepID=A0ACC1PN55_9PEZI|nr:hypothetical protein NUW58_g1430 [Xylaria curta]